MWTEHETQTKRTLDAQKLADTLNATEGVDAWQFDIVREEEAQLYLIGNREEAQRTVTNERARITILNEHFTGQPTSRLVRGSSTLTVLGADFGPEERLRSRLADAVAMARLTDNQPYTVPAPPPEGYPSLKTSDPAIYDDLPAAAQRVRNRIETVLTRRSGVRLSSAEIYTSRSTRELHNNRGLVMNGAATRVFLDMVLIARDGDHEAEFHAELSRRRIEDLALEDTVDAYATYAMDSLHTTEPATYTGPVMLTGEALSHLFSPLVFHTSALAKFQQLSRFTPGEYVTGTPPVADALTLISDAQRPYGTRTAACDSDGLPARRVPVIENGVLQRYWADNRYATYLGIDPTGDFGNLTIERGGRTMNSLRSVREGPVYEIVSFSWMNPDTVSGDFVAEIRLGYRHDVHGTTPIKGGSLSGNLFEALANIQLAERSFSDGDYFGPAAIRFGHLTIAGS